MIGDDGVTRCPWGVAPAEYRLYHDDEWGRPVGDDNRIYEKLCLEGFQSGLSWLTVLRKGRAFGEPLPTFDPAVVATFDDADVERLLLDASIIRHRAKIEATIANARAVLDTESRGDLARQIGVVLRSAGPPASADLGRRTAVDRAIAGPLFGAAAPRLPLRWTYHRLRRHAVPWRGQ